MEEQQVFQRRFGVVVCQCCGFKLPVLGASYSAGCIGAIVRMNHVRLPGTWCPGAFVSWPVGLGDLFVFVAVCFQGILVID